MIFKDINFLCDIIYVKNLNIIKEKKKKKSRNKNKIFTILLMGHTFDILSLLEYV